MPKVKRESERKGSLVGYARVSTADQKLDSQFDQLHAAGCIKVFHDKASGAKSDRPGRNEMLGFLREGDTVVVTRLDRYGRSLQDLINQVNLLKERGIGFRSLAESIDTTTPQGRMVFHVFAALAEFIRELIVEQTHAGLNAARARGKKGGRKPKVTRKQLTVISQMMKNSKGEDAETIANICDTFSISKTTLYRYVDPQGNIRKKENNQ